ncbi:50S ribosomal protein L18 [Candidatus Dependentiae bacterium]|nr:50S ribosomal protein L18 [Candidatus Dependentiae bacterium]
MGTKSKKQLARLRRRKHIRKNIYGTADKPRLSVFRSLKHIYVQVIDDESGKTLASASTLDKELKETLKGLNKFDQAAKVGEMLAERMLEKSIKKAVFDRGGYLYHGRLSSLANSLREKGIKV